MVEEETAAEEMWGRVVGSKKVVEGEGRVSGRDGLFWPLDAMWRQ